MFILKLAFKNIMRNHRRTLLTTMSITYAVIVLIFVQGFVTGVYAPMRATILDMQTGHVRILPEGYSRKERLLPVNMHINSNSIENELSDISGIELFRPRIRCGGLVAKGESESDGMMIIGIRPESEENNVFLKGTSLNKGQILLSRGFAEKNSIMEGDTVVVITPTKYGYLNGMSFTADQFYETGISMIANSTVFVHIDDARFLIGFEKNQATELMIMAQSSEKAFNVYSNVKARLSQTGNEDILYYEGEGSLIRMMKIGEYFTDVFLIIIFALASIAIINTMIMALYERTREIGMMKSLGLTNRRVFAMFLLETIVICIIGAAAGVLLGSGLTYYFQINGIDFSAATKGIDFPAESIWYTQLSFGNIMFAVVLSIISGLLSSLFLIRRVWRINPADVLRE